MLAALDGTGAVTYIQARYLDPPDGRKYDNPAHHLGHNPRLAWPRPNQPTTNNGSVLVVCEGIPDALTAATAGLDAVAVLGTGAVNDNVARQIIDHAHRHGCRRVVVAFDADPPGDHAAHDLATLLHSAQVDLDVSRLRPPERYGGDLNSWSTRQPNWSHHLVPANGNEQVESTHPQALLPMPFPS